MDLIQNNLCSKYPEVSILIDYLKDCPFDLKILNKKLEEHYGRIQSEDRTDST